MIFVLGMPRSGTTWLGKLFDSHPDVRYLHEPDIAIRPTNLPVFIPCGDTHADEMTLWLDRWLHTNHPRVVTTVPVFAKRGDRFFGVRRAAVRSRRLIYHVASSYMGWEWRAAARVRQPWGRPVLKSVNMLGRLPAVLAARPDARVVHLIRHPAGQCASQLRALSRDSGSVEVSALSASSTYLARGLSDAELAAATPLEKLAWKWACFNDEAIAVSDHRVLSVRYEDLVDDPEQVLARVFDFCGLSMPKQTIDFLASIRMAPEKEGGYSVVRDPQRAAWGWRKYLSEPEMARLQRVVAGTRSGAMFVNFL